MKIARNKDLKVIVIIPAYNEEESITETLNKLLSIKREIDGLDICVINDGSRDRTAEIVKGFDVILIDLPYNMGIGGAMQTGYKYAYYNDYDIAIQFDADGQHNYLEIKDLIEPLTLGQCDMVIGSRFITKEGFQSSISRRLGILILSTLIQILTGKKITDPTSGFRAKNKKVIERFASHYPKDYPEPEVLIHLHKNDLVFKEIAVIMHSRQGGVSSITPIRSIYYMIKVCLSILISRVAKGQPLC